MKKNTLLLFLLIGFIPMSCTGQSVNTDRSVEQHTRKTSDYVQGEILIKFKDKTDQKIIASIQKKFGLTIIKTLSASNLYLMKIADDASVEQIIEKLKDVKEVAYAEPNYIHTIN